MPRIISDIDGTVLNYGKPIKRVVSYIKANSEEVIFLTNRPESERKRTVEQLKSVGIKYQRLIMNKTGEEAPAFKSRIIKEMLDDDVRVDEFIDDRADTRRAVKALGVKVTNPRTIDNEDNIDSKASYNTIEKLVSIHSALTQLIKAISR